MPSMFAQRLFTLMNNFTCFWVFYYFMIVIIIFVNDPIFFIPLSSLFVQVVAVKEVSSYFVFAWIAIIFRFTPYAFFYIKV